MDRESTGDRLTVQVTRRRIVATGTKLLYAAPIIAATFHLTGSGALAAVCPSGFTFDESPPPGQPAPACCKCGNCVLFTATYDPVDNVCRDKRGRVRKCAIICEPAVISQL